MNTDQKIFDGLEPEVVERLLSRRNALKAAGKLGVGLAIVSAPITFAALSKSAFAQGGLPQQIIDVLNFALTLEYLEAEFYQKGVAAQGLIPASDMPIFSQISKHETAHVALLKQTLGSAAVAKPTFDFTAGGVFPDPFLPQNYAIFQTLAQAFEDTGVRAYKGQAGALKDNNDILTVALQIHSVEARHASEVRRLRGQKGWVTVGDNGVPSQAAAVYAGEENTTQATINVGDAESFDEPLTKDQVLAIASLFIKP